MTASASVSSLMPTGSGWNAYSLDYCSVHEDRKSRSRSREAGSPKMINIRKLSCLSSKNVEWCRHSHLMDGNQPGVSKAREVGLAFQSASDATAKAVRSSQTRGAAVQYCLRDDPRRWSAHDTGL